LRQANRELNAFHDITRLRGEDVRAELHRHAVAVTLARPRMRHPSSGGSHDVSFFEDDAPARRRRIVWCRPRIFRVIAWSGIRRDSHITSQAIWHIQADFVA
jgi:hypothetical protein